MRTWISLVLLLGLVQTGTAAEIFVGPPGSGSDNSSCGSSGSPCATPRYAVNNRMVGGACDIVTIRAGTYTSNTDTFNPPSGSGTGCQSVVRGDPNASRGSIIIRPGFDTNFAIPSSGRSYITFRHMTWDGSDGGGSPDTDVRRYQVGQGVYIGDSSTHHITFDDLEMRYMRNSGFLAQGNNITLSNSYMHH